jgi:DNA replication protein DnaT
MSGWIKWEKSLETDPRVLRISRELQNLFGNACAFPPVTLVCGALIRLWSYADSHIRSDNTIDMSAAELDEVIGIRGFCEMLPDEWLREKDARTVELPNFQEHNGVEARKRALTQKRVAQHRNKLKRNSVTTALPDQDQDQDHKSNGRSTSSFDLFWEAYPKKNKKKDALKVWQQKQLDKQAEIILADLQRRPSSEKWRKGFIPDPTTYLRGDRWNDEIEPAKERGFVC